jgi:hypothetical protein
MTTTVNQLLSSLTVRDMANNVELMQPYGVPTARDHLNFLAPTNKRYNMPRQGRRGAEN